MWHRHNIPRAMHREVEVQAREVLSSVTSSKGCAHSASIRRASPVGSDITVGSCAIVYGGHSPSSFSYAKPTFVSTVVLKGLYLARASSAV